MEPRPPAPLLPRGVSYPAYHVCRPTPHLTGGTVALGPVPAAPWKDRSLTGIGPALDGFPEADLATIPSLELEPGSYEFELLEPYTLRYLTLSVLSGGCEVAEVGLRELCNPDADGGRFACSDPRLVRIFET